MLEKISDPSCTIPDRSAKMLDVMRDTSFEDQLPLPEGTRVSHQIGYYGTTYADAAIIFPEGAGLVGDEAPSARPARDTGPSRYSLT